MPHFVHAPVPNQYAHGFILATLNKRADAQQAMSAIRGLPQPPTPGNHFVIATVSHFEQEAPKNTKPKAGDVIAIFANSDRPIQDQQAHDDLHDLADAINNLPPGYFKNIKHW